MFAFTSDDSQNRIYAYKEGIQIIWTLKVKVAKAIKYDLFMFKQCLKVSCVYVFTMRCSYWMLLMQLV